MLEGRLQALISESQAPGVEPRQFIHNHDFQGCNLWRVARISLAGPGGAVVEEVTADQAEEEAEEREETVGEEQFRESGVETVDHHPSCCDPVQGIVICLPLLQVSNLPLIGQEKGVCSR